MYLKYEGAKDYTSATYPFSRGAGIQLGLAAGGRVKGGDYHTPLFGAVLASDKTPAPIRAMVRHFPLDRPPFEIFVNSAGKRFLCEDVPSHNTYEQSLRAQPDERCWVVFDDAIYAAAPVLVTSGIGGRWTPEDTAKAWNTVPMFYRADTLADLGQAARIDAKGLEATVADYNRAQATGKDRLGRQYMPLPIAKPPYYAVQLQSWNLLSYGGLAVDGKLRVTRANGTPIPNLYAAGELLGMGQINGRATCGGMSVTPALALGRLLGHEILPIGA
jgi:fumarate reductase flavoprotein subunit